MALRSSFDSRLLLLRAAYAPDPHSSPLPGAGMTVMFFALTAMVSTAAGGLFALRFRDHMHLILGFTAGVLLGVVAFDILPEIFALAAEHGLDPGRSMIALVVGFLLFHSIEKLTVIHHAQ